MVSEYPTQPEARLLYYAALCGFRTIVEHLTLTYPTDVNAVCGASETPLNAAFMKQDVETARVLLRSGAITNIVDVSGESLLHRGANLDFYARVKLLLEHQADVNMQTREGWTS